MTLKGERFVAFGDIWRNYGPIWQHWVKRKMMSVPCFSSWKRKTCRYFISSSTGTCMPDLGRIKDKCGTKCCQFKWISAQNWHPYYPKQWVNMRLCLMSYSHTSSFTFTLTGHWCHRVLLETDRHISRWCTEITLFTRGDFAFCSQHKFASKEFFSRPFEIWHQRLYFLGCDK